MVTSVTFPETGNGYIYEKYQKPGLPPTKEEIRSNYRRYIREYPALRLLSNNKAQDQTADIIDEVISQVYNCEQENYKKEMEIYNDHKNEFILPCSDLLVGKTFNFAPDKINIIFGPNASGKSTIIKAIVGHALIEDGYPGVYDSLNMYYGAKYPDDPSPEDAVKNKIEELSKNSASVEWSGNPIYYNNFEKTLRSSCGQIGDIQGSILSGTAEEVIFHTSIKNKISDGQMTNFMFSKIVGYVSENRSLSDIIEEKKKYMSGGSVTQDLVKKQIEYFSSLPDYGKKVPMTLVFDEIDKSLDITVTDYLYNKFLPDLMKKYGCQIILVSHNPIILADQIYKWPIYNFINLDSGYTAECRSMMKTYFKPCEFYVGSKK